MKIEFLLNKMKSSAMLVAATAFGLTAGADPAAPTGAADTTGTVLHTKRRRGLAIMVR